MQRCKNSSLNNLNIHNLTIQSTFRDSINNITEITNLAQRKRTDMPGHAQQVYNVELDCFQQLKNLL